MSTYVFDQASETERRRLLELEAWLDPGTIRHLETIGVAPGWHCLEVGAGEGSIARWLCARVGPSGRVVATDLDTRFLDVLEDPGLEVRRHDVVSDPLEEDAYDLIHARLLLEHLPGRDDVVRKLVQALRPGGWLLVEDLDGISHVSITKSDVYERVSEAAFSTMATFGFDPHLGRRLYLMLDDAGLEDCYAEGRIAMGTRVGNPGVEMFKLTLGALREAMVTRGRVASEEVDETLRLLDDPSFIAMPPAVIAAWGRRPAGFR
jgi:SAM-dependent methyltransferase